MSGITRRRFLRHVGGGALAGSFLAGCGRGPAVRVGSLDRPQVPHRVLGKTGLNASVVGFGGHSWSYDRVPDPRAPNGRRPPTLDEAREMIRLGLDMGVNYFDGCTPQSEHDIPGQALADLGTRRDAIICIRSIHRMRGTPQDKQTLHDFINERLRAWHTDYVDIMFAGMATETYWDMTYAIEALEEIKKQGQARFVGFGSHFSPANYREAIARWGAHFDICSMPYNVRHRAAEQVFRHAERARLGIVTIKPFARGSLFESLRREHPAAGDADLAAQMVRFVAGNRHVDVCLCGVHTLEHVRQTFGAAAGRVAAADPALLDRLALAPKSGDDWLENAWRGPEPLRDADCGMRNDGAAHLG